MDWLVRLILYALVQCGVPMSWVDNFHSDYVDDPVNKEHICVPSDALRFLYL